jgi:hypothetical protein
MVSSIPHLPLLTFQLTIRILKASTSKSPPDSALETFAQSLKLTAACERQLPIFSSRYNPVFPICTLPIPVILLENPMTMTMLISSSINTLESYICHAN